MRAAVLLALLTFVALLMAQNKAGPIYSGMVTFVVAGNCPGGFSEVAALNGKTLIGTLAANGNVGQTGGADSLPTNGTITVPNAGSKTVPAFVATIDNRSAFVRVIFCSKN